MFIIGGVALLLFLNQVKKVFILLMASLVAVLQCVIIYLIMAEGGFYFKDDGAIHSEDELGVKIYLCDYY